MAVVSPPFHQVHISHKTKIKTMHILSPSSPTPTQRLLPVNTLCKIILVIVVSNLIQKIQATFLLDRLKTILYKNSRK